jgi:hypothetical protein
MRILRRRWIAAMLLTTGAVIGAAATMGDRPWLRPWTNGIMSADSGIVRTPPARLIIRNDELDPIRGRVNGPGKIVRAFLVPPQEVHDMVLQPGEVTIEFDTSNGTVRRSMKLAAGQVATVDFNGS